MRSSHQALPSRISLSLSAFASLLTLFVLVLTVPLSAQNSEQVEVGPPPLHRVEPPAASATSKDLETIGDELQADKNYLDAIDYYEAASRKDPTNAVLMNKVGMSELLLRRYKEARKNFDRAIKVDKNYANAYANLGVVYYQETNYGKSIHYYDKAIQLDDSQAVFYNNRAASLFVKKEFEKAMADYNKALQLDPDIFERAQRSAGVQAKLPSPGDIAHYDYVLAKLFARNGSADRSLHYLKKAMEEGYPNIKDVYKDQEFSAVRKDPRFAELMAAKTVVVQN
ncbi:MAG: tetratricopeptide repeat protein [Terriglobales bacterium]